MEKYLAMKMPTAMNIKRKGQEIQLNCIYYSVSVHTWKQNDQGGKATVNTNTRQDALGQTHGGQAQGRARCLTGKP